MRQLKYISICTAMASLTACGSSDIDIQHADNYEYITFAAQTEKMVTRAKDYEAYSPTRHPQTMGAFGYYDISGYEALTRTRAITPSTPNPIYDNNTATYDTDKGTWANATDRRWNNYLGATSFDFFAYMPQTAGAEVERTATDTYTLTIPFTMPTGSCFLTDTKQLPIVCATPEHKEGTTEDGKAFTFEHIVKMKFDQTMTAYQLQFQLGTKMNAIRQFRIKTVAIKGEIATAGNITRTYKWENSQWTAENTVWANLKRQSFDASPATIPMETDGTTPTDGQLVSATNYTQWGPTFYTIPDATFLPTISVTYDVKMTAEDGTTITTRKDVTSTIQLNKNNFSSLATGKTAIINPIRILIQPRYLYVLADDDAYTGHLLIE